ncbi:hypothetical protein M011DRAFT_478414 [Sporormia fimetaria CBS 119925]|uniref:Uncharacterized protein n=1 Tax=Sporormia fimetaria CBS 119925 TaxID=1340428 RepID=A0A6A6V5T3_9PLEO|nr:hypothetical protein M011DRAFT_478414 [Sporormia fimetaria CBS 119925]
MFILLVLERKKECPYLVYVRTTTNHVDILIGHLENLSSIHQKPAHSCIEEDHDFSEGPSRKKRKITHAEAFSPPTEQQIHDYLNTKFEAKVAFAELATGLAFAEFLPPHVQNEASPLADKRLWEKTHLDVSKEAEALGHDNLPSGRKSKGGEKGQEESDDRPDLRDIDRSMPPPQIPSGLRVYYEEAVKHLADYHTVNNKDLAFETCRPSSADMKVFPSDRPSTSSQAQAEPDPNLKYFPRSQMREYVRLAFQEYHEESLILSPLLHYSTKRFEVHRPAVLSQE